MAVVDGLSGPGVFARERGTSAEKSAQREDVNLGPYRSTASEVLPNQERTHDRS